MSATTNNGLPKGQRHVSEFARFGLPSFAKRLRHGLDTINIQIKGDVKNPLTITDQLKTLQQVSQTSDFHCVTTWSVVDQKWSGVSFSDFYQRIVLQQCQPLSGADFVVFEGLDGYRVSMQLQDLRAGDVLLADSLNGEGLGLKHGAPLRLIAPAHYGYKNAKHICAISFLRDSKSHSFPFPYPNLMEHPRARVALEERTRFIPNWLVRPVYRMLIGPTRMLFSKMS